MTLTPTRLVLTSLLVLALAGAVPAAGQTFTGDLSAMQQDLYLFDSAARGQYEVTLTWDDPATLLAIFLLCGDNDVHGISAGERQQTARLSVGIPGNRSCALLVAHIAGGFTDYSVNFQSTGNASVTKVAAAELPEPMIRKGEEIAANLRDLGAGADSPKGVAPPGGPTSTFLEQIQGGVPKSFTIDVGAPGLVQITAMWNRQDTSMRISMFCNDGSTGQDWGFSESRQERTLRFDADVFMDTECEITLESPNTMVFALNVAFLDEGGLLPSI